MTINNVHIRWGPLREEDGTRFCRLRIRSYEIGVAQACKLRMTNYVTENVEGRAWIYCTFSYIGLSTIIVIDDLFDLPFQTNTLLLHAD